MIGDRGGVARAMQDTDDDNRVWKRPIVDGIGIMEGNPKTGAKLLPCRRGEWKVPHRFEHGFDRRNKTRGDFL
jgi:hypothetical protein